MRVLVMGGGVVGVTTAYQFQLDGHEVVAARGGEGVAQETSWGNAGMIAPGHSFVWSSPKAPGILLKSLVLKDQALRFKPSLDPQLCGLVGAVPGGVHGGEGAAQHAAQAPARRLLAARPARDARRARRSTTTATRAASCISIATPPRSTAGVAHMKLLDDDGQEIRVLDREGVLALEPSLRGGGAQIAGGIYCPTDETGDCNKFTAALAARCAARGAEIHTGTRSLAIETAGDVITRRARPTAARPCGPTPTCMALGNGSADPGAQASASPCRSIRSRAIR